jgi:hypothetical protein
LLLLQYHYYSDNIANIAKKGRGNMNNLDLRNKMDRLRLRHWEVAEKIGISDSRLSVWLRTPLNENRKKRVTNAINELTKEIKA